MPVPGRSGPSGVGYQVTPGLAATRASEVVPKAAAIDARESPFRITYRAGGGVTACGFTRSAAPGASRPAWSRRAVATPSAVRDAPAGSRRAASPARLSPARVAIDRPDTTRAPGRMASASAFVPATTALTGTRYRAATPARDSGPSAPIEWATSGKRKATPA